MGTVFTFKVEDELDQDRIKSDVDVACSILEDADLRFSLYKPDSEISKLNAQQLSWEQASPVQKDIREQVQTWKETTGGFFDPVSPEGVYDPSGLVKTWAASNAAMYLEANGYRDFTLNAGGDVLLGPAVKSDVLNRVGLSNLKPISSKEGAVNMILDLRSTKFRAVATSGVAERGEHIWRRPSPGADIQVKQATVVATDLITADIWATAIVSGGSSAVEKFESSVDSELAVSVVTYSDGRVVSSPGFAGVLANLS